MKAPADQASRDRFTEEIDRNFSVIASAGSGKTRAITDRIVAIAKSTHARAWLPQLVVVTFTNRAADEMQQRARQKILDDRVPLENVAAFNRAFFGTIHSFCLKLLMNHGHHLGLPAKLDLISDEEELWNQFVQRQTLVGRCLSEKNRALLFRLVQVRRLMELGRRSGLHGVSSIDCAECEEVDFSAIHAFVPDGRSRLKIEQLKIALREWEDAFRNGNDFLPVLLNPSGAQAFAPVWREALAPLRSWMSQAALCVGAEMQRAWREFRLEKGALTYDDQIALAGELMRHPQAARRIREKNHRVILDEAQDTDPEQFSLLLEIARPVEAGEPWLTSGAHPPRPGHFCMVGDFQQSIYGGRADLAQYRRIHEALVQSEGGGEVKFSVTFRLDQQQLEHVNATFSTLLNNDGGQVEFVELQPRPDVLPGQVVRLDLDAQKLLAGAEEKITDRRKAEFEAGELAQWLVATGLPNLRAQSWRDVAILCPRKAWFRPLAVALRRAGLEVQIQSESDLMGDSPAYAWFTALLTVMAEPHASYEIVGVLREIFGVSDDALAFFARGSGSLFQIETAIAATDGVARRLNLLAGARLAAEGQPLFTAVAGIVAAVQLRERLATLPPEDFPELAAELDSLLTLAATAEAGGKTLAQFAENLRANFDSARSVQPAARDAVQLITAQKAKGSEWQAVIVPFLSRKVITRHGNFPRVIRVPQTDELVIALDREGVSDELRETLKVAHRQEMERLLYVACTRARHTLVLVSDFELFANKRGALSGDSQTKWLRYAPTESNHPIFASASTAAKRCPSTDASQQQGSARQAEAQKVTPLPAPEPRLAETARANASRFARKLNPSGLAAEPAATDVTRETEPELWPQNPDSPALLHGTWWHGFVQQLPWGQPIDKHDAVFAVSQPFAPDAARAQKEWKLLRALLTGGSELAARLNAPTLIAQPEMPFLWPVRDAACLEGVIDLALFDRAQGRCFVLDWKTNRLAPDDDLRHFRERYRPQLAAYWKALSAMTGLEVEAGLYATHTGAFALYDAAELAAEWARLESP